MSVSLKFEPHIKCNCDLWLYYVWPYWQILTQYCKFLMPWPLKRGILSASTIILSKDIDKCVFMCGSNFYETDVNYEWHIVHCRIRFQKNNLTSCASLFLPRFVSLHSFSFCWCFQNKFLYFQEKLLMQVPEDKMYFPNCCNRFLH